MYYAKCFGVYIGTMTRATSQAIKDHIPVLIYTLGYSVLQTCQVLDSFRSELCRDTIYMSDSLLSCMVILEREVTLCWDCVFSLVMLVQNCTEKSNVICIWTCKRELLALYILFSFLCRFASCCQSRDFSVKNKLHRELGDCRARVRGRRRMFSHLSPNSTRG